MDWRSGWPRLHALLLLMNGCRLLEAVRTHPVAVSQKKKALPDEQTCI
jgi:hypothetical protein